jgi:hypothetical protein
MKAAGNKIVPAGAFTTSREELNRRQREVTLSLRSLYAASSALPSSSNPVSALLSPTNPVTYRSLFVHTFASAFIPFAHDTHLIDSTHSLCKSTQSAFMCFWTCLSSVDTNNSVLLCTAASAVRCNHMHSRPYQWLTHIHAPMHSRPYQWLTHIHVHSRPYQWLTHIHVHPRTKVLSFSSRAEVLPDHDGVERAGQAARRWYGVSAHDRAPRRVPHGQDADLPHHVHHRTDP